MIKAGEAGGALEAILQAPGRLQGEGVVAQAEDQGCDGLPDRRHLRRVRDRRLG